MLGIGQVDVTDVVDNLSVDHLTDIPVPAAIARLHVEDGDLQPFGADGGQGAVGVTQDEDRIGLLFLYDLIALCYDVTHRLAQVLAHTVQVVVGLLEAQVLEEDLVERIVPVLSGVDQDMVEVLVALLYGGTEADDLRPRTEDGHDFHSIFHHISLFPCNLYSLQKHESNWYMDYRGLDLFSKINLSH